ncbi:WD40-repeat-containing domain protein [Jimgerdemannia flammicorona]|uniref:WD40-repeat-containing domain protein n=1 Tax=Jimgerdemannia flammicorona TaxID=994334 RepID=A0A433QMD2_9FUNG|nr:WD40-repeat-containing domain protein [Jimgerdemannia flammicorona]
MNQIARFDTHHEDLIHDVAYDYYGKRLATCSSDQRLKVWDFDDDIGSWEINEDWKGHDCSIIKVVWAHPEYGQVIASCSFDRTVKIWEEQEFELKNSQKRWAEKARLVESRGSVQDIEFSPSHMGLKLAICAADGIVRIYEAMEVTNIAHWTQPEEFEIFSPSTGGGGVGGTASLTPATASTVGSGSALRETEGSYCLSWYPGKFLSPMMAVGCGKENCAKIFKFDSATNKWFAAEVLGGHEGIVHDIAWAPNMGRSYQLIATACKDHHVRIFKLTEEHVVSGSQTGGPPGSGGINRQPGIKRFRVETVANFSDHGAEVWRVEWNVTGTILSSSGDDGKVRLWKAGLTDDWRCMSIISAEQRGGDYMDR